ncbi:uncharacterized protein L969DRAFT_96191 [Mixia osmundae IAM 14324]|uniref:Uncharacterized protein n=1 Tax=Mixia osmundae (strain CBS 9802 / IAM 14324 / JCM 22182 / KY 12970) TaxID=764103 RepID=G7E4Q2_MIXOS|nr:uncharacterized protein L969DRAFT_96191 [Mixia osmundae IAM 14324]KEI37670.1 hypothetical protein L969DRAFT_96191 [Mixia osmundae IAM 14324]GAA97812.1 hypothetical protein E5Q_04491 [Mixia osmundae IAM 14324]
MYVALSRPARLARQTELIRLSFLHTSSNRLQPRTGRTVEELEQDDDHRHDSGELPRAAESGASRYSHHREHVGYDTPAHAPSSREDIMTVHERGEMSDSGEFPMELGPETSKRRSTPDHSDHHHRDLSSMREQGELADNGEFPRHLDDVIAERPTFADRATSTGAAATIMRPRASKANRPSPTPAAQPSRHRLFYRDLLPPILQALALGSIAFYALSLLQMSLDAKYQAENYLAQIAKLEAELAEARTQLETGQGNVRGELVQPKTGWRAWIPFM